MKETVIGTNGEPITLYLQDCIKGMRKEVRDGSVDVVVTSPPYNIGVSYNSYYDKRPRKDYLDWIEDIGKDIARVLKQDGSFFLNVGGKPSDPWIAFDIIQRLRDHFVLQNVIHWVKSIAINKAGVGNYPNLKGDISVGHYKPIGGQRFLHDCHEYIFQLTKTGRVSLGVNSTSI